MSRSRRAWPPARLHIVTGKGGTGKTTIAGALALALASDGRRTLLVEVEGRQGIAQLFDTPPLPYADQAIAVAPGGGEVRALAIDPEAALLEYLATYYNIHRAGRMLRRLGAVEFVTTIAPGLRDVLLTGKIKEAATRVDENERVYDAVIVDSPPTGRIIRFLNSTAEMVELVKVGPIKSHSGAVSAVLHSSQTAVHLVSMLEDMPAQEAIDAGIELRAHDFRLGSVVINMSHNALLPPEVMPSAAVGKVKAEDLAIGLQAAAIDRRCAAGLARQANDYAVRCSVEQETRDRLRALDVSMYEMPALSGPVDLAGLYELADRLREQGVT